MVPSYPSYASQLILGHPVPQSPLISQQKELNYLLLFYIKKYNKTNSTTGQGSRDPLAFCQSCHPIVTPLDTTYSFAYTSQSYHNQLGKYVEVERASF